VERVELEQPRQAVRAVQRREWPGVTCELGLTNDCLSAQAIENMAGAAYGPA
jgi:hypothetical protein